jgi:sulfite reductase (NADPH) flavoprotein alpha-component
MTQAVSPVINPYSRNSPFLATLTENRKLNKPGSQKDTRHIILDLTGSGIDYKEGDSLGVIPINSPELVNETLQSLRLRGDEPIKNDKGETISLQEELTNTKILNRATRKFVKLLADKYPEGSTKERICQLAANEEMLGQFVEDRDFVDILKEFPACRLTAEEFASCLAKIAPRLYSIASSHAAHPGEVHLTVALVSYETHGRKKFGLATGYLANHVPIGGKVPVYIQQSKHFHLPEDGDDIIMVGPGTGIAPFRAFLEKRKHSKAKGRNWLFFGDQHQATDFLYEEEFETYLKEGVLTRLDTAFSRDQAGKVYVQDRMRENGAELWKWIQNGAHFYVCGDAKRMAKDVETTLIEIAHVHGGFPSTEAATDFVKKTMAKEQGRYQRDVY